MSLFNQTGFVKVASLSLMAGVLAVTGCAIKKPQSKVVVAPIAINNNAYGNDPYTGGPLVDNNPAIQQAAANIQTVVHFDFDSDVIRPDAAAILDQHAVFLTSNPTAQIQIAGHTDERGSREYNMSLGERRATAVGIYLANRGVDAGNIAILSFGEEQPVATGSNEAAWAQNRRAELTY